MSELPTFPLIAVDIGNTQMKLGRFDELPSDDGLPQPSATLQLETQQWEPLEIALWLAPRRPAEVCWRIASVQADAAARLADWLAVERADERAKLLAHDDLPLDIELLEPHTVGIDRLLGAVAANRLRDATRAAIVVDLGSAITVDAVSARGSFLGGAILPGIGMASRALTEFTHLLPDVGLTELADPPPALGTSTHEAIGSGIYWGAIGAIRLLIERLRRELEGQPQLFLTGGAAPRVAAELGDDVRFEPHLILAGLVLGSLE
ncbi:MAG: type III pantothenate kinase [Planctomycetota bacterium]|nr:MAG: type III pantothenate kinase [Planctomycetota bacterium]REJ98760.1 MAG: type III pantothenate kinase [Planctomycetota bacterium]REK28006.1 MAG: type III pantothenate kinase [Planctomycetota bacterium]REK47193.1 MAG: type III pantothenate kinase [Planctomycetota bacterium]